ncbi:hypothetical protein [Pseudoxanthomonas koreensis]|uniref:hypothetical protein n=1 Tax=Pseudoxanthomonas koreensis TaxID=266061 RepID=UPI0035A674D1
MRSWVLLSLVLLTVGDVSAHKLAPEATPEERRLAGITSGARASLERLMARWSLEVFTEPVHEEITNHIYGCNGDVCAGNQATTAPPAVLAGVRWNDDPPFQLLAGQAQNTNCKTRETVRFETQPLCWVALFRDAKAGAARGKRYGPGDAMLYRSHFGDLQFLHAMAAADGESAATTRDALMGWFEFAWRASLGEYTLDTRLKDVRIPVIQHAFGGTEWRVMDLYTLGASGGLRRYVADVAFGSLLHAVQDSFAAGHVRREEASGLQECHLAGTAVSAPGRILEFHSYAGQDHGLHAQADSRKAFMRRFQEAGNVVEVSKPLVRARTQALEWHAVEPYFDCLFTLQRPEAPATAGDFLGGN